MAQPKQARLDLQPEQLLLPGFDPAVHSARMLTDKELAHEQWGADACLGVTHRLWAAGRTDEAYAPCVFCQAEADTRLAVLRA